VFDLALSTVIERMPGADDLDRDLLPDVWEDAYLSDVSDPSDASGTADPDGDGMSNLEEYIAGTDPLNEAACLALEARLDSGQIEVAWDALPVTGPGYAGLARHYALQARTHDSGQWLTVSGYDDIVGAGQPEVYALPPDAEPAFYRVRVWLAD
jgi:hypothetical protein